MLKLQPIFFPLNRDPEVRCSLKVCSCLSARAEELLEVVELAVDVSADGDRRGHGLHVGLLQQQVTNDIT